MNFEKLEKNSLLNNIEIHIKGKYNLEDTAILNKKELEILQHNYLMNKIKEKSLHSIIFNKDCIPYKDEKSSYLWLKNGKINPRIEGALTLIQDRNYFMKGNQRCQHCNKSKINIDHLATKCEKLLSCYKIRHDEVLRSIHLSLISKYNFSTNNKMKNHIITKVIENSNAKIITDMNFKISTQIKFNKPDIIVFDKIKRMIRIIEIGITSRDNLQSCESYKKQKYIPLANELSTRYKMQSEIIPFVITWDGIVTKFNKEYRNKLEIDDTILGYIQTNCLKKTFEIIVNNPIRYDSERLNKFKNIEEIVETLEINEDNDMDVEASSISIGEGKDKE